ncbi:phage baseplate assembly protein V [Methylobacterium sp. WSM2598]|uniref:phage baseplate assembly protein V n=1 Tax=Methylobacterium sp. WSM2598 TaxID=398261 RepID=UPI0003708F35|nr:phage baseplate assembly protein V [Methylobacterium sp. WSM2598]
MSLEAAIRDLLAAHLALQRRHEALETRVANLIRVGPVTERDHEKGVRFKRGDSDEDKSPWMKPADSSGRTRYLPQVGEQVIGLAPNGDLEQGTVLPFDHSDQKKNPSPDADTTTFHKLNGMTATEKGGEYVVEAKKITLKVGSTTFVIDGSTHQFTGGTVKHEAKNIGADHKHTGVKSGAETTDVPA